MTINHTQTNSFITLSTKSSQSNLNKNANNAYFSNLIKELKSSRKNYFFKLYEISPF